MNEKDIKITDWERIFMGEVPAEFLVEVVLRMAFIYIVLVVALRLMGRRMEAMVSRGEMVSLVTLGASVGVAIHTPERGMLPSALIIVIILSLQTFQGYITSRNAKAEGFLLDEISTLVEDGRMLHPDMKKSRITKERLLAALRFKEITNLGVVQRVYFEAKGVFSIVTYEDEKQRYGLCILPEEDSDFRAELEFSKNAYACRRCGNVAETNKEPGDCNNCRADNWENALKSQK